MALVQWLLHLDRFITCHCNRPLTQWTIEAAATEGACLCWVSLCPVCTSSCFFVLHWPWPASFSKELVYFNRLCFTLLSGSPLSAADHSTTFKTSEVKQVFNQWLLHFSIWSIWIVSLQSISCKTIPKMCCWYLGMMFWTHVGLWVDFILFSWKDNCHCVPKALPYNYRFGISYRLMCKK